MNIKVVHLKKEPDHVNIGRPSVLGNPFSHKAGTKADILVATREEAVSRYREWILEKIESGDAAILKELNRLLTIFKKQGYLNLGCWCAPQACHGDVLKEILETMIAEEDSKRVAENTESLTKALESLTEIKAQKFMENMTTLPKTYKSLEALEDFLEKTAESLGDYADMAPTGVLVALVEKVQQFVEELKKEINGQTPSEKKKVTFALTGHRPNKLPGKYNLKHPHNLKIKEEIKKIILESVNDGYEVHCISGMALGADTIFAHAALELRDAGSPVTLECAIPCKGHPDNWPVESQKEWGRITEACDKYTLVTDEPYKPYLMQVRNEYMVDNCEKLIAIWNSDPQGGTANCVNYAKKVGKEIIQIDPTKLVA